VGAWSDSIMGGDTPLDIKAEFEDRFGSADPDLDEETVAFRIPTADESAGFMVEMTDLFGMDDEFGAVLGFLLMERGAPMRDDVRQRVYESIEAEMGSNADEWNEAGSRRKVLTDFRADIAAYPAEGAKVEMPHQPGLMETIFNGLAAKDAEVEAE
jgi:hypothetical protein